jgi:ubiquinone/menaquinone biosynthesis C-methylase UbiE
LNRWYVSVRHGADRQNALVLRNAVNRDVLEYGCADGEHSLSELNLPQRCRSLAGIDISDVAIAKAAVQCDRAGLANTRFLVMNAEAMTFPDQSFDLVFGRGILHHLDLKRCLPEIARVLRKDGKAIFSEPMGHNPIINYYRRRTPELRTADEHPLRVADLELARRYFAKVETTFYGLFSAASALVDTTATGMPYRIGRAVDDLILRVPVVGRFAWYCLIVCHGARAP